MYCDAKGKESSATRNGRGNNTPEAHVLLSGSPSASVHESAFEIDSYDIFLEYGFEQTDYE